MTVSSKDRVREARDGFAHVLRGDCRYIGPRMVDMELTGRKTLEKIPGFGEEGITWFVQE